ncbi:hypothetical protein BASA81_003351 [Batrachochytrium salamandrivorans]|nr:hypothetical protein BASA81_003952 [Batrachochytrium salamandrivorans]KAH9258302.1 hypothetical protein BASA81_003351 [Batrachochytrium salamandrivorans]
MNRILPLPQQVVDRIAAGEVIQRPFSAVKELIENSVDAGATQITVTVKTASSFIQVQDNGKGIHPDDFGLICHRFNTSKLRQFDDLKQMSTYGFRGEALSSITHVAKVTITSQQSGAQVSLRAEFADGKMTSPCPSKVAGNPGTTITIEDLFYNVPQRLRGLKSSGEEMAKIMEVVAKYALLYSGKVGFVCKRAGVHTPDVHTTGHSATVVDNVRKLFGGEVAKELVELQVALDGGDLHGWVTNPNFSRKRGEFVLFINGRLVDSSALKRTCDACYQECLPKGTHPFVMLVLSLPLDAVDVNIHPTKREVAFLREEEICLALAVELKAKLLSGSQSRTFETSKLVSFPTTTAAALDEFRVKTPPSKQVRTDFQHASGGLERFLVSSSCPLPPKSATPIKSNKLIVESGDALELESVHALCERVTREGNATTTNCLRRSVFVGVVDHQFSLVQYDTSLVVMDHVKLGEEALYQRVLEQFGRFEAIHVSPPIDLLELVGNRDKHAQVLLTKRALLHEYFHITITAQGQVETLPRLYADHVPLPRALPKLFRNLGGDAEMDWTNELSCFQGVARQLAAAYAQVPEFRALTSPRAGDDSVSVADRTTLQYQIKNLVFPLIRRHLVVPEAL